MLLKGIPAMTVSKAAIEQQILILIAAKLERPRTSPVRGSGFISFWFVCMILIMIPF